VHVEITPEPTPEEREALLVALKRTLGEERDGPGAWWKAGVLCEKPLASLIGVAGLCPATPHREKRACP
jgi:hypothetical protein